MLRKNVPSDTSFTALKDLFHSFVDSGTIPMASLLVCKNGREILNIHSGSIDAAGGPPPSNDTIYRIFSMTKPVVAVAAMMLRERGRISLDDPVGKFIPGFNNQQVFVAGSMAPEPVKNPCRVRHILGMTSGVAAFDRGDSPGSRQLAELKRRIEEKRDVPTLEAASEIGKTFLEFHPGEGWYYGLSMDIVGAVIEAASGKRLSVFLEEELFRPLGMNDTAFFVPSSLRDRMSGFFQLAEQSSDSRGKTFAYKGRILQPISSRRYDVPFELPEFEQGGDGLYSTPTDYMKFLNLLLDGRSPSGRQLLSQESLRLMTKPETPITDRKLLTGYSYGLGVRVLQEPGTLWRNGIPGEFGWYGHAGSWGCVEPETGVTAAFFTQLLPSPHLEIIPEIYEYLFR